VRARDHWQPVRDFERTADFLAAAVLVRQRNRGAVVPQQQVHAVPVLVAAGNPVDCLGERAIA